MAKLQGMAFVCLVAMLGALGCSSSSGGGGDDDLTQMEAQVSGAVQVMSRILIFLDPFNPASPAPAAKTSSTTLVDCIPVDEGFCNGGGEVSECTTEGVEIEVRFDACSGSLSGDQGTVNYYINGLVTYAPDGDWPPGSTDVVVGSDTTGDWEFDMTFNGTAQAQIFATDDQGTHADCVGSLVTYEADCEFVEQAMM
jgi:hypothetical protein